MTRFLKRSIIGILLLGLMTVGVALYFWLQLVRFGETAGVNPFRIEMEVFRGTSPRTIAHLLEDQGLISSADHFYNYVRYVCRCADDLKAGDYMVDGTMTPSQIVGLLRTGRAKEYRLTIPEGSRKEEILRLIAKAGVKTKDDIQQVMARPDIIQSFGVPQVGAGGQEEGVPGGIEGYLFPDTYRIARGMTGEEILWRMRNRLNVVVDEKMQERMNEMGWNLHQVLTLASIVEKETANPVERPLIAGVFMNRIHRGMKLQTDPTVVYGMEIMPKRIRREHLQRDHAYNTYLNFGLPPGPIASPGKDSIEAVLWPTKSKYLYFVSRNDGTHEFCENYACHKRAIQKYQLGPRRDRLVAAKHPPAVPYPQ